MFLLCYKFTGESRVKISYHGMKLHASRLIMWHRSVH